MTEKKKEKKSEKESEREMEDKEEDEEPKTGKSNIVLYLGTTYVCMGCIHVVCKITVK